MSAPAEQGGTASTPTGSAGPPAGVTGEADGPVAGAPDAFVIEDPTRAGAVAAIYRRLNPDGPKDVDPREFRQLLAPDDIAPIYSPTVGTPSEADVEAGELVIGVSLGGEHRAYPIKVLRFREMANDVLGGVPILVTW